jgi:hypothetical protein
MVLMHMMKDGTFVIGDVKRGQWGALEREKNLLRTVENDAVVQFYRRVIASKTETIENKFRAATELLDRTWGRPSQEVTVNRDTNVSVKIETFEEVQRGLQDFGLDIHGTPLKLLDLSKNEDDE